MRLLLLPFMVVANMIETCLGEAGVRIMSNDQYLVSVVVEPCPDDIRVIFDIDREGGVLLMLPLEQKLIICTNLGGLYCGPAF
ncbi:MAG: hypothetical protein AAB865_00490 [Patescibacteria group bacterium]